MQPREIQSVWLQLSADQKTEKSEPYKIPSAPTETIIAAGTIRLAVNNLGLCSLLIPTKQLEVIEPEQKSELISMQPVTLGVKGQPTHFVDIRCEDERLVDVFAKLVSDILSRIETGTTSLRAVDEALIEFRRLLHKGRSRLQDERAIAGLIGELHVLLELLEINPVAWSGWHGPSSDRHDFRSGDVSIEVKTSLGADGRKIHINGIQQLATEGNKHLLIRHIRVEPDPGGTLSVPDLVARAGTLVSNHEDFESRLANLGYADDSSQSWALTRFRLVGSTCYEVRGGFPRIIPDLFSVPWPMNGVSAVSYEVDLAAAGDFVVDDERWERSLREFCKCL